MKIYLFRGEKSLSAEMKIVFTELLIYERNEKHEESLSQVIVCLREKKGLLSCNFSPPTPFNFNALTISIYGDVHPLPGPINRSTC